MTATLLVPFFDPPITTVPETVQIGGHPLQLLFPIPITAEEQRFTEKHGPIELLDRFEPEFDYTLNPWRNPVV